MKVLAAIIGIFLFSLLSFAEETDVSLVDLAIKYKVEVNVLEEASIGQFDSSGWNRNHWKSMGMDKEQDSEFRFTSGDTVEVTVDGESFRTNLGDAVLSSGLGTSGLGVGALGSSSRLSLAGSRLRMTPPWKTATGKYPILPSLEGERVFEDLSLLAKEDLLRGDLYTREADGTKIITPRGEQFEESFCSQVKHTAQVDERRLMGMSFLPDTPDSTKRTSEVHLFNGGGFDVDQGFLYRISAAAKDFYNKLCERQTAGECFQAVKEKPDKMDAVCKEVFQTHFLAPHIDLQSTYLSSLFNNHTELASQKAHDEFLSQASCGGGGNCYFMPSSGSKSCDPFHCSMADKDSLNTDSMEWSKAFLLGAPDFKFASSDLSLCDKCFREQYTVVSEKDEAAEGSFDEAKKRAEKELVDRLAANAAGKALLDFSAGLETAFDLSKLYPQTFEGLSAENFCAVDFGERFKKLSSEGCANGTGREDVKKRLAMAAKSLGLEEDALQEAGGIVRSLALKINPDREGNSCKREDFVKSAKLQWNSIGNQEYVEAFRAAVNETTTDTLVSTYCKNENLRPSSKNVADVYSESAAEEYWNEKGEDIYRLISSGGNIRDILLTENCPVGTKGSVAERAVCGKGGAAFQGLAKTENGRLQMLLDQKRDISKDDFEKLLKRSVQLRIKAALEVPMKLDPGIRLVLTDWDLYCKSRFEEANKDFSLFRHVTDGGFDFYNPDTVLQLHDFVESVAVNKSEFRKKIDTFRGNLCDRAVRRVESSICRGGGRPDLEKELAQYSPEDIKKAQSQLEKERSLKGQLAMNSLSCSLKTLEREKPDVFSSADTTLASALGLPSSFEEKLAAQEREKGFGENAVSQWGLNFNTWDRCSEATKDFTNRVLGSKGDSEVESTDSYDPDKYMRQMKDIRDQYASAERKPPVIASGGGGSLKGGEGSAIAAFFGFGKGSNEEESSTNSLERKPLVAKFEKKSVAAEPIPEKSAARSAKISDKSYRQTFEEDAPSESWSPFSNAQAAARRPASLIPANSGSIDNPSFSPVVQAAADAVGTEDSETLAAAEEAGIKNIASSNDEFKKAFEDALEGKLKRGDLEELRSENERLKEEMRKIRSEVAAKTKPVKVLDASGEDRTSSVPNPEASAQVVLNPRNQTVNEFRSRSYFEDRKSEYSPNFSSAYRPERISLKEYSSQRRAIASKTPVGEVKEFNAKIDASFLQKSSSSTVNDNYVESYVEHVNRNSGSIEHLVVFENGRPARIRVPDPQNPGKYVERPLTEELAEKVLKEVEGDEISSYAVYNMVSFGKSLQDFMASLEREESNLAALDLLNRRLEEAKNLD